MRNRSGLVLMDRLGYIAVVGDPPDVLISATRGAVISWESSRAREFRIEGIKPGPLEISVEWRGKSVTRVFHVCKRT